MFSPFNLMLFRDVSQKSASQDLSCKEIYSPTKSLSDVGNKAAVFPLQLLGFDVDVVNSVHFSNHTGFPGGWEGDAYDAFDFDQLNEDQKDASAHLRKLLSIRKDSEAIHHGGLKHYIPKENVYVYARTSDDEHLSAMGTK